MRAYFLTAVFALFWAAVPGAAQSGSGAIERNDNQIWHETVVGVPLTKKLTLNLNGALRFGANEKRLVDNRAGFGFAYRANKNVALGTGYLYRVTEPVRNRRNYENRFVAFLTVSKNFGKFVVSDRNQFEYQARNSRADKQVYRNRLQIERAVKLGGFQFNPFASAEVFYDSQFKAFSRLRFVGGATKRLNKLFALDAYYLRQQDGRTRPGDLNVFGTTLRVNFDFFEINK